MKMRSMEMSKKESKAGSPMVAEKDSGPSYPYGLEISLDDAALRKLGMNSLPEVGSYVKIRAEACVTSVSSNERKNDKPSRSVRLQIERLAVDDEPESMEEAVEKGVLEA